MEIVVKKLGKQFQEEWIFKELDYRFNTNQVYAVTGPNGSGKSTFLQVISGFLPQTAGEIIYQNQNGNLTPDDFYKHISVATPYTELIEEFSTLELLNFHFKFKKIRGEGDFDSFLARINLSKAKDKIIKNFSSGMKQRLKLGLAFFSDTPIILLDEPTSNLDSEGIHWYQELLSRQKRDRITIISSNQAYEYEQSDQQLDILSYKPGE
jgi:ABC-type multidrug transport system ATPase subunit